MYVVAANSAFNIEILGIRAWNIPALAPRLGHRIVYTQRMADRSPLPGLQVVRQMVALAVQGVVFSAVLWMLVAGPGFLTARDSLVPSETLQTARQASR